MPNTCPARDELAQFSFGRLEETPAEQIATHVDSCANCRTVLEEISRSPDTLAVALRQPAVLPFAGESALQRALPRVQAFGQEASAAASVSAHTTSNSTASLPAFKMIRDYEILEKLGEGGMGAVYKARHSRLKKIVALKILPRDRVVGADVIARFEREMEAVGKLEHPHLVRAMDAGESEGVHFLVMEYVGGCDLSQLVRSQPLSIADACELIRQAAVGLQHVHEQGLVHRDIKPSNLMLSPQGTVKILDLGLALLANEGGRELTTTGQMMGTIDYMAPEQGGDTHHVDIRADIYSLGASLYKLLSGVAPFGDPKFDTPVKKLMALAVQEPIAIRDRRPEIPAPLAAVVTKMLAKEPKDRYATPAAVAAALAPFTAGSNLVTLAAQVAGTGAKTGKEDTYSSLKSASVDTLAPSISPAPTRLLSPSSRLPVIGLATLAVVVLLAAIVFFVQTPHGTVKVTVNDPRIDVRFNSTGATVHGADEKPINLKFGEHEIEIKRGDFKFTTTRFKLEKKGETTLAIEFLPGELKVVYDGKTIERTTLPAVATPPQTKLVARTGLLFDDRTDAVDLAAITYDGSYELTIEGWFRTLEAGHSEFFRFEPDGPLLFAMANEKERNIAAEWQDASGKPVYAVCVNKLRPGELQHLAVVYRRQKMLVFVDGVPIAESTVDVKPGIVRKLKISNTLMELHGLRISRGTRYVQPFEPRLPLENDAETLALFPCDDRGNDLRDVSANQLHGKIVGAKWVRAAGVAISPPPTLKLTGNLALEFDGKITYVEIPTLLPPADSPLTIEAWAKLADNPAESATIASAYSPPACFLLCRFNKSAAYLARQGQTSNIKGMDGAPLANDAWHHVAGVWDGKVARIFVNGKPQPETLTLPVAKVDTERQHQPFTLGGERLYPGTPMRAFLHGQLDEIHISKFARYEKEFAPQRRLEADQHTLALYHCDEGKGDVLEDASSHKHHGRITKATWVAARTPDGGNQ